MTKGFRALRFRRWLLQGIRQPMGPHGKADQTHPWWAVMCLTGVDYFSTLGYQPGIAFLAAGYLSPMATFVLVMVTLFGAYPVYRRVAEKSPDGQGSVAMLERLFPAWSGKSMVLVLLGFAATDFIITMTLSAADATAHVIENPFVPAWMDHRIALTLLLLSILCGIFLMGFREAIHVAVPLVGSYLALNVIVVGRGLLELAGHPEAFSRWREGLVHSHGSPLAMAAISLLLFPKLALGLSGFETGVAVMPLVTGDRVRNTQKLLLTAALIMSVFLMGSSIVTALLIDAKAFQPGGAANGRALAYMAHQYLGEVFGTVYDISTILILSFAGASAMAGLLNLVPRYLPRYGMAPDWARATRPLVLVFGAIGFAVTLLFRADVDAQGGAYATGVLVLMTSAATAVTISLAGTRVRWAFIAISAVFVYTTIANIIERPEGIRIAAFFIALTVTVSLLSRALRSTELRVREVNFEGSAREILEADTDQVIRLVAHRPARGARSTREYDDAEARARLVHNLGPDEQLIFVEIERTDASEFDAHLDVKGDIAGRHSILRGRNPSVPNALAGLLLAIGRRTGKLPHIYFGWTEGHPVAYVFRFIFLGEGDVAPITREILRRHIPNPDKRPIVHVG